MQWFRRGMATNRKLQKKYHYRLLSIIFTEKDLMTTPCNLLLLCEEPRRLIRVVSCDNTYHQNILPTISILSSKLPKMDLFQSLWKPFTYPYKTTHHPKDPQPTLHIIFILPNIYQHISGVSNKYIAFIQYLVEKYSNDNVKITLCNPSGKRDPGIPPPVKCIDVTGFPLPLYNAIKIPLFLPQESLRKIIREDCRNGDHVCIIFNSEFFWLYSSLIALKKEFPPGKVSLIPNMHTDIDYYLKHYLGTGSNISIPIPVRLEDLIKPHLLNGNFDKFLVTGDLLFQKYKRECELLDGRILNVNEIDAGKFVGAYRRLGERRRRGGSRGECLNVIYCGRVGVEKNILHNFLLCDYLLKFYLENDLSKIQIHVIGKGPYLDDLRSEVGSRYPLLFSVTKFHGAMDHSQLCQFYQRIENPIFLFSSMSETFGKTSAEALAAGIPLFHIHSPTADLLYRDCYNAFLFGSPAEFVQKYDTYMKMNGRQLEGLDQHMREFAQKYDQRKIFEDWYRFLIDADPDTNS